MTRRFKFVLAACAAISLLVSAAASAQNYYDPPGRVARISDMRGEIAYSPAGDGDWYPAHRNRPLVRGDALWSDRGARAELQAGSNWVRMDQETSVEFLELNDRMLQLEVTEGTINVRIRRMYPGQRVEVDTPNIALVLDRPGSFRIDVDRENDNTTVQANQGGGMVYGVGGRFPLRSGDVVVFYGEDVRDYDQYAFPAPDSFDRYVRIRDQRIDRSISLRYLGDELVGFGDLDDYGRWSRYPDYGAVWFPTNVYSGWAPYQDGQWVWQDPWGWTWVDDEPWAFAPSHYGRWAWIEGRWGWIPGPRTMRPTYAPALVAFIEDIAGAIGWFPLGPGDIYYPSYSVSPTYFNRVNLSNSRMAAPNLGRAYSSFGRAAAVPITQGAYRNRSVPTAITVVPKDVFTNSQPVRQAAVRADVRTPRMPGEIRRNLDVRPGAASMRGAMRAGSLRPPRAVEDEQVVVRNAPPPQQVTPAATATPAPAAAVRERPRRVRMITEQSAAADARASGPRAEPPAQPGAAPAAAAPAAPRGRLQPLDREALPRMRGGRRLQERQQQAEPPTAPVAPTPPAAPTPAPAPAAAPAPTPAAAAQEETRQLQEAQVATQKAREERRQAMEAERKARIEQQQAEQAQREAQVQRAQAEADSAAQQQREAAQAETKAAQEREQARAAALEAQRQQRESERAQQQAQQQQREATQASAAAQAAQPATPATPTTPAAPARPGQRDCVPAERIDAMRKRGVSEERIAALKVCPAEPAPPAQQ